MNADLLLHHFNRLSDAPDAVSKLRQFVVGLAVRGMIVPQDKSDEPASVALARIRAVRADLIAQKKIKPIRAEYGPISVGEDFDLPFGWMRATINETCDLQTGATPDRTRSEFFGGGIRWLLSGDINKGEIHECEGRITECGLTNSNCKVLPPNSIMMALNGQGKTRATVAVLRVPAACNQSLVALIPFLQDCLLPEYLFWNLRSRYTKIRHLTGQDDRRGLNMRLISCFQISVPPVSEQRRIVAKVADMMAFCDQLDAEHAEREFKRNRLTLATHTQLENSRDEASRQDHARFLISHLDRVSSHPYQIGHLRQTILNLATRGQLVKQSPSDEPVECLLRRIPTEIERLQRAKNIRAQKPALPTPSFEIDSVMPETWANPYLQDLAYQITDGTHLTPTYTDDGRPFLSAQNVKPFRFLPGRHRFVSEVDFDKYRANRRPERGDILLTRVGAGIGEAAVLDSDLEFAFYVSLCLIKVPTACVTPQYLVLWLNSPQGRQSSTARTYGKGASQGNLNLGLIRTLRIPLPPIAEQHRIVAKVDELMALCDRLEGELTKSRIQSNLLLESVLDGTLTDYGTRNGSEESSLDTVAHFDERNDQFPKEARH